jgi:fimbrial chaperone protein
VLRKTTWAAQLTALALFCAHPMQEAVASSFMATPVTFDLTSNKPMAILQLSNNGDNDVRLQVHAVKWGTDGSKETQDDTDDLIINPPVFTIKQGGQQFLRFGLRSVIQTDKEQSYRLILTEVPDQTITTKDSSVLTVLQISIPVFINPMKKDQHISWHLIEKDKKYTLVADNSGNTHLKLNSFTIVDNTGATVFAKREPAYVLPGQRKEWPIVTNGNLSHVSLKVVTPEGQRDEVLDEEVQ